VDESRGFGPVIADEVEPCDQNRRAFVSQVVSWLSSV
jgi:hypothetical protein